MERNGKTDILKKSRDLLLHFVGMAPKFCKHCFGL